MFNIMQGQSFIYDTIPFDFRTATGDIIDLTTWQIVAWVYFPDAGKITLPIGASIKAADTQFIVSLNAAPEDTLKWPADSVGNVRFQLTQPVTGVVEVSTPMLIYVEENTAPKQSST